MKKKVFTWIFILSGFSQMCIRDSVGTTDEIHQTERNTLLGMDFPYFSLMIIRPAQRNSMD